MPIGYTHPHSYGITDCDSHSNSNSDNYACTYSHTYTNTHSDGTTTDSYANSYGNCNANCDSDANSKPIWECMPAANDHRPYEGSRHAVQFHGTSKHH